MKWTKYCGLFRVLSLGVLNGTVRFSSLSGYLVSSGRQVPPKVSYSERFCHKVARMVGAWGRALRAATYQPPLWNGVYLFYL
jgi:hypothetical protein